jgi:hypothetical protein
LEKKERMKEKGRKNSWGRVGQERAKHSIFGQNGRGR